MKINAIGKPCPLPVIEVKKAIRELNGVPGKIEILVDNDIARQNISKMAEQLGYQATYQKESEAILVTVITTDQKVECSPQQNKHWLAVFDSDEMGKGNAELGKILLKSYIYSLTELDTPPDYIICYNRGAFLTTQESAVLMDLKTLISKGTTVYTCGTCLDYYQITEQLAVGEIVNMYMISELLSQAEKIVHV